LLSSDSFEGPWGFTRHLAERLDCFINVEEYQFCSVTQKVSIAGSILFLMVQLLISRIIFPGVSNFLNASVWSPPLHARGSAACHVHDVSPFDGCF
jgi:hypothetical protein